MCQQIERPQGGAFVAEAIDQTKKPKPTKNDSAPIKETPDQMPSRECPGRKFWLTPNTRTVPLAQRVRWTGIQLLHVWA